MVKNEKEIEPRAPETDTHHWSCYTTTPADSLRIFEKARSQCPVAHSREHEVRDGRGTLRRVCGVDHAGFDRQVDQLADAADYGPDGTAAGRPSYLAVREFLLCVQRLLRSCEDLLHVKAARSHERKPTSACRRFSQSGSVRPLDNAR